MELVDGTLKAVGNLFGLVSNSGAILSSVAIDQVANSAELQGNIKVCHFRLFAQ